MIRTRALPVRTSANAFQPRHSTQWQRERMRGPILPMKQAPTSLLARLFGLR